MTARARSTSAALLARPSDARTAPTATSGPRHSDNLSMLNPSVETSLRQRAVWSAGKPNATSDAPGLQKHPPRSDTPSSRARLSTLEKGITRPARSCTLKVTVGPRSRMFEGPYSLTSGRPLACVNERRPSSRYPASRITCALSRRMPTSSISLKPSASAAMLRKSGVPSSKAPVAGERRRCV